MDSEAKTPLTGASSAAVTQPGCDEITPYALSPAGERFRLLVTEDDPVIRQLLATMLQRLNFELDLAENGEQALEKWSNGDYDLVLMDIQMPYLDGFATTREIRGREAGTGKHIIIVAMTAHASHEDQALCVEAGMDAYISKPIDFKKSLALINDLLQQRTALERPVI